MKPFKEIITRKVFNKFLEFINLAEKNRPVRIQLTFSQWYSLLYEFYYRLSRPTYEDEQRYKYLLSYIFNREILHLLPPVIKSIEEELGKIYILDRDDWAFAGIRYKEEIYFKTKEEEKKQGRIKLIAYLEESVGRRAHFIQCTIDSFVELRKIYSSQAVNNCYYLEYLFPEPEEQKIYLNEFLKLLKEQEKDSDIFKY